MSTDVINHIQSRITDLIEKRVGLIYESINIQNGYFKTDLDLIYDAKIVLNGKIEKHIKEYENIFFKIKALSWEIKKELSLLESVDLNYATTFRFVTMPKIEIDSIQKMRA